MTVDIQIEHVGQFGEGVGSDEDGNVYFVPRALPGDRVRVSAEDTRKRYRDAVLVELLEPSLERVEPPCAHFEQCGGCDWLHWDYSAQVGAKEKILQHALARAQILSEKFLPMLRARRQLGYRNRIQVRSTHGKVGFLRRHSHEMVPIQSCAVADVRLNQALESVRQDAPTSGRVRKSELFLTPEGKVGRIDDALHAAQGFEQINTEQNAVLQKVVAGFAEGAEKVLELYCGNGNLSFGFADKVGRLLGVDASGPAIAAALARRAFLSPAAIEKIEFIEAPVSRTLGASVAASLSGGYDTLVLDPPRVGTGGLLPFFLHPGLRRVVYVSCSTDSFIKDVQCLKTLFRLQTIQPIDMFPHTRHLEFVASFSR